MAFMTTNRKFDFVLQRVSSLLSELHQLPASTGLVAKYVHAKIHHGSKTPWRAPQKLGKISRTTRRQHGIYQNKSST